VLSGSLPTFQRRLLPVLLGRWLSRALLMEAANTCETLVNF
jgi:hypothetical protein